MSLLETWGPRIVTEPAYVGARKRPVVYSFINVLSYTARAARVPIARYTALPPEREREGERASERARARERDSLKRTCREHWQDVLGATR